MRQANGMLGRDPTFRFAALDLVRGASRVTGGQPTRDAFPEDLDFLVDNAHLAVTHPETLIANYAAHAVVRFAEDITGPAKHIRRAIRALQMIAVDPRSQVRKAAAYGSARLKAMASSEEIREAAAEVFETLVNDPYAIVNNEARYGVIDAKRIGKDS